MSDKREIIATGIKNLTDARYFAAMGVDWMGFDLRQEPRMSPEQMHAIMDWVEGPRWLVEIDDLNVQGLPEGIQGIVHSTTQHPAPWSGKHVELIRGDSIIRQPSMDQDVVLIELNNTNNVDTIIPAIDTRMQNKTIWIRARWTVALLQKIVDGLPGAGIVLSGSAESAVGVKDYDTIDTLFDLLEKET